MNSLHLNRIYFDFYDKNSTPIEKKSNNYSLCDEYLRDYYDLDESKNDSNLIEFDDLNESTNDSDESILSMVNYYKGFVYNVETSFFNFESPSSFQREIFPIVFNNLVADNFWFYLKDSAVSRNIPRFSQLDGFYFKRVSRRLERTIVRNVQIRNVYNLHLNDSLLSESIFGEAEKFRVHGHLRLIDKVVFRPFMKMNSFEMDILNLREFFHNSYNEWIGEIST